MGADKGFQWLWQGPSDSAKPRWHVLVPRLGDADGDGAGGLWLRMERIGVPRSDPKTANADLRLLWTGHGMPKEPQSLFEERLVLCPKAGAASSWIGSAVLVNKTGDPVGPVHTIVVDFAPEPPPPPPLPPQILAVRPANGGAQAVIEHYSDDGDDSSSRRPPSHEVHLESGDTISLVLTTAPRMLPLGTIVRIEPSGPVTEAGPGHVKLEAGDGTVLDRHELIVVPKAPKLVELIVSPDKKGGGARMSGKWPRRCQTTHSLAIDRPDAAIRAHSVS